MFLIEIKSRPGRLTGDAAAWTWTDEAGHKRTFDNPLLLANRKCKRLKDLLGRQSPFGSRRADPPYIQALVFCSATSLDFQLAPDARMFVCLRDNTEKSRLGIRSAVFHRDGAGLRPAAERLADGPTLKAFAQAMAQAGIRPLHRKVADFILDRLRYESPSGAFQDWEAHHTSVTSSRRLVRLYLASIQSSKEDRQAIRDAALREFHTLEKLDHPGILKPSVPAESELGPANVFEFDQTAQRLDHFLAESGVQLDVGLRVDLLRQVADAIRYAHGKGVIHRALSPQSVFVLRKGDGSLRLQIYNWHTGGRLPDGSFSGLTNFSGSLHAAQLLEDPSRVFLAPEALNPGEEPTEAMDIFSLGALAYFLFAGQPPARDATDLLDKLKTSPSRALEIRDVRDGVSDRIAQLIRESARGAVPERCSIDQFLSHLDGIEDDLTRPDNEVLDPREAEKGARLSNGFLVERKLGRGASAIALLVGPHDAQPRCVLKVAREPGFNSRLDDEFQTLSRLQSPNIVKVFKRYELNGLSAFTVELAGERTLARLLKEDGPPDLELLQRYGEELIRAVEYLDEKGIFHRDIKPENIGIGEVGAKATKRLRLFDFSLSSAPPTELRFGTQDYLDPFLEDRKARRYDLSAELYSVGMTLHEIATGERAKWKGGHPRATDEDISLRIELFDPDLRDPCAAFFQKALNRNYRKRFDNAREMLRAWNSLFETVDRPTVQSEHGSEPSDQPINEAVLARATPEMQVALLGLSTRLMNVLERIGVHTVSELLRFRFGRFEKFRGVGRKTQLELISVIQRLRQKFPEVETPPALGSKISDATFALGQESVDQLAHHAMVAKKGKAGETERSVLHPFLGMRAGFSAGPLVWPSQSDLAASSEVTRQRIGQIVTAARIRWAKSPLLAGLRDAIAEVLRSRGGVLTHGELVAAVLTSRGSVADEADRVPLASAATRAAIEAEHGSDASRFDEYRSGAKVFVALHGDLRGFAVALGRKADELAALDPLPSPGRVNEELRQVRFPEVVPDLAPPIEARLRQLAVAAASKADLSSRGEIYPPGLDAGRAIALARNALFGDELTPEEVERRLRARFPKCASLPPRPQLDDLLRDAGLEWNPTANEGMGAYRSKRPDSLSPSYSLGSRQATKATLQPSSARDPVIAEAARIENRLRYAAAEGGYLILTVEPSLLERASEELAARFDLHTCDLDGMFLELLRAEAESLGADWNVVLTADAAPATSEDWGNLQMLVDRVLPEIEKRVRSVRKTCLLLHPGLLTRYGRMNLIAALAADVTRPEGPAGLWLLVPDNGQHTLPTLNGAAIPIMNAAQHTRLTSAWLRNDHRAASANLGTG